MCWGAVKKGFLWEATAEMVHRQVSRSWIQKKLKSGLCMDYWSLHCHRNDFKRAKVCFCPQSVGLVASSLQSHIMAQVCYRAELFLSQSGSDREKERLGPSVPVKGIFPAAWRLTTRHSLPAVPRFGGPAINTWETFQIQTMDLTWAESRKWEWPQLFPCWYIRHALFLNCLFGINRCLILISLTFL